MTYTVIIPKPVQKQLDSLPDDIRDRILEKILPLAENPCPEGVVSLKANS
jgi:mRNA interferase RelE/StbE